MTHADAGFGGGLERPMLRFDVHHDAEGTVRVAVFGDVDYVTAPQLRERMAAVVAEEAPRRVEVDLAGVPFIDSSALAVLTTAWRQARAVGARFALVGAQPDVLGTLMITGVAGLLGVAGADRPG